MTGFTYSHRDGGLCLNFNCSHTKKKKTSFHHLKTSFLREKITGNKSLVGCLVWGSFFVTRTMVSSQLPERWIPGSSLCQGADGSHLSHRIAWIWIIDTASSDGITINFIKGMIPWDIWKDTRTRFFFFVLQRYNILGRAVLGFNKKHVGWGKRLGTKSSFFEFLGGF